LINGISYGLAQSDPIKQRPLWSIICQKKLNSFWEEDLFSSAKVRKTCLQNKNDKNIKKKNNKKADGILFFFFNFRGTVLVFQQIEIVRANQYK
jgi:hypothetical protein